MNKIADVLNVVKSTTIHIMSRMENGMESNELIECLSQYSEGINQMQVIIPANIYCDYDEFISAFISFCQNLSTNNFDQEKADSIYSSLKLITECVDEIIDRYTHELRICACCGKEGIYLPLPSFYYKMRERSGSDHQEISETLNPEKYICPNCGSSDRDRMIVSFMKRNHLEKASPNTSILQVAPAKSIEYWIKSNCPQVKYETTDLFMDGVTYKSDIQDLKEIEDEKYDLIICSHVLEHVQDDYKAMASMKRVLKANGKIAFLVPIDLSVDEIDEEWGLSETENWRRFGQGDHCRRYSKAGLIERLDRFFYVSQLGKEYFGEEVFDQCGLTDTSTLYVLTKSEETRFEFES